MTNSIRTASPDDLPRLLFHPLAVVGNSDEIGRAIETAERRWPTLRPPLETAARLVRVRSVFEGAKETSELALIRLPGEWNFRAVSPTLTGLACTCGGWPPTTCAGPGDGLYCPDILAYLLVLYLKHPLSTLSTALDELWQATLEELRLQMTRATFNQWLLGSAVVPEASTPLSLTVAVRNRYAQEWLNNRLHHVIVRTLAVVAGYRVQLRYIVL